MPREKYLRPNAIAAVIAFVVLLAGAGKIQALLQGGAGGQRPVIIAQAEPEGAAGEEHAAEAGGEHGAEEHGVLDTIFHWVNFLLIGAAIWYLGKKYAVPMFAERSRAIREDMQNSARVMAEASHRLTGIEAKLNRLDQEIQELRETARKDVAAEQARMEEMAAAEAGKIAHAAEQEIATATKAARRELQRYSAELAVGLAEKRIRETISATAEKRLLQAFVKDLENGGRPAS